MSIWCTVGSGNEVRMSDDNKASYPDWPHGLGECTVGLATTWNDFARLTIDSDDETRDDEFLINLENLRRLRDNCDKAIRWMESPYGAREADHAE